MATSPGTNLRGRDRCRAWQDVVLDAEDPCCDERSVAAHDRVSFQVRCACIVAVVALVSRHGNARRYVITDFTQHNLDFWRQHESFASFIDEGIMDIAIFGEMLVEVFANAWLFPLSGAWPDCRC